MNKTIIFSVLLLVVIIIAVILVTQVNYKTLVLHTLKKIKYGTINIAIENGNILILGSEDPTLYKCEIFVKDEQMFFRELALNGDIGLGETFVSGVWYTRRTDDLLLFLLILSINMDDMNVKMKTNKTKQSGFVVDEQAISHHYDVGNDFYFTFLLDSLKAYSCGFWLNKQDTLQDAQYNKVHKIIDKLQARPGQKILDIGCGWGHIASYVQKRTKANVYGITLSHEQIKYIQENIRDIEVEYGHYTPKNKEIRFDKVYSIGMFEHVRCLNYVTFFRSVWESLLDNGDLVLHTITTLRDDTRCSDGSTQNFLTKYIFPDGQIPKIEWVVKAAEKVGFKLTLMETFAGHHYAKTLVAWRNNMLTAGDHIKRLGYSDNILKTYEYYMNECAAAFYAGHMQVTQFVFKKTENTLML